MVNEYTLPVKITKLIVIETRIPNRKPWSRGYKLEGNVGTLQKLHDVMHRNIRSPGGGASRLEDVQIAAQIPEIISLDMTPQRVDIENGWDAPRGRFLMETTSYMGNKVFRTYIQGYTNYLDTSVTGMLDPEMELCLNSVISTVTMKDPVNGQEITSATEFYNVIADENKENADMYEMTTEQGMVKKLIRPEDILTSLFLVEKHNDGGGYYVDSTDNLGSVQVSRKANNEMFKYFRNVTNSFIDAKNMAQNLADRTDILYNAQVAVNEPDITKNPFFRAVFQKMGAYLISKIKLKTIVAIDPSLRPVYVPRRADIPMSQGPVFMDTEDTADTLNPTPEVIRATIIANMLPSFMCELMVTNVSMSLTNKTGENIAIISDIRTFVEGLDPVLQIDRMTARIVTLLMPKLSDGGMTLFEIFITADILGEITVAIRLYNDPLMVYRFPAYADSLFTPVVTTGINKLGLINDFQNVLEQTY